MIDQAPKPNNQDWQPASEGGKSFKPRFDLRLTIDYSMGNCEKTQEQFWTELSSPAG